MDFGRWHWPSTTSSNCICCNRYWLFARVDSLFDTWDEAIVCMCVYMCVFSYQKKRIRDCLFSLGCITIVIFPILCNNRVQWDLDSLDILQNITLIHSINGIMLIGQYEQLVCSSLEVLIRHMWSSGWVIDFRNIQGPDISEKFLGVQWSGTLWDIPDKVP